MPALASVPIVPGFPVLGSLPDLRRDRIGFFCRVAAEFGDLAVARVGVKRVYIASAPELIHEVLVEKSADFEKGFGLGVFARPMLGNGLLTSEREFHRRQRRMIAPAFVQKRIGEYAQVITARSEALARAWSGGVTVDVSKAMMQLTLEIVGKTLFDTEIGAEAAVIGDAVEKAMEYVIDQLNSVVPLPPSLPTRASRANRANIARLDATIYRLIRERRAQGGDKGDFLSMLLAAQAEDGSGGMTDVQVRDEAMTIFLAGHETTANALAWTFYLLAQHPEVRQRLEREVDAALGEQTPTLADLARLPYTLQVFKEAMRLYPPVFATTRKPTHDITIGGHRLLVGDIFLINVIGMHRREALFPDPYRFDPERFAPEAEKRLPRFAYLPFGAGPRVCIGNHFALMEGHLVLATLLQRVRLDLLPGYRRVEPEPLMTLRPRGGITMSVTRRVPPAPATRPSSLVAPL